MLKDHLPIASSSGDSEDTEVSESDYASAASVPEPETAQTTTGAALEAIEFIALDDVRDDAHRAQLDVEKLRRAVMLLKARKLLDG